MGIIIGTMFAGQVKSLHGQYIASKLFFLGIPLFPTMSMLVVKRELFSGRNGIEIPKHTLSIIASYLRIFSIPVAVLMYFLVDSLTGWQKYLTLVFSILVLIYVWFLFGRSSVKENFIREQMGKLFQVYFMPEWLYYEDLERFQKVAIESYNEKFGEDDWESRLMTTKISDQMFALVYCRAYLTIQLRDLENKRNLLDKKYDEYLNHKTTFNTQHRIQILQDKF